MVEPRTRAGSSSPSFDPATRCQTPSRGAGQLSPQSPPVPRQRRGERLSGEPLRLSKVRDASASRAASQTHHRDYTHRVTKALALQPELGPSAPRLGDESREGAGHLWFCG